MEKKRGGVIHKKVSFLCGVLGLLIAFAGTTGADQNPDDVLKAVVRIRALVPDNARTARILGSEREGNGVIIDSRGYILTIGYLILEAEKIEITASNNEVIPADFVGYDHNSGLGLIRAAKPIDLQPIKLGQSAEVKEGDPVLVAGFGGPDAVMGAQVISRQDFAGYWEYLLADAIFTTPPHPSFGGAALIGRDGELLGIGSLLTPVTLPGLGTVSSNMFVPIDLLKPILPSMIARGRSSEPSKPWLGIYTQELQGRLFVVRTTSGSPAEKAGLQPGDIILKVNKQDIKGLADFYRKIWALGSAGVIVPLSVLQGTNVRDITVQSGDRDQYLNIPSK
ncbi:S1C family serine protease [Thermodesulfobacteriota bacterium]